MQGCSLAFEGSLTREWWPSAPTADFLITFYNLVKAQRLMAHSKLVPQIPCVHGVLTCHPDGSFMLNCDKFNSPIHDMDWRQPGGDSLDSEALCVRWRRRCLLA